MYRRDSNWGVGVLIAFVLIALCVGSCAGCYALKKSTEEQVTFTVDEKERVQNGESSKYLVFSEGGTVYEVTDDILYWRFDSSDVYNQLDPGGTYECTAFGWRWHLFSWYKNLKDCTTISPPPAEASP